MQVIHCTKTTRGNGKDIPARSIVEIHDFAGNVLAEKDPYSFTIEEVMELVSPFIETHSGVDKARQALIAGRSGPSVMEKAPQEPWPINYGHSRLGIVLTAQNREGNRDPLVQKLIGNCLQLLRDSVGDDLVDSERGILNTLVDMGIGVPKCFIDDPIPAQPAPSEDLAGARLKNIWAEGPASSPLTEDKPEKESLVDHIIKNNKAIQITTSEEYGIFYKWAKSEDLLPHATLFVALPYFFVIINNDFDFKKRTYIQSTLEIDKNGSYNIEPFSWFESRINTPKQPGNWKEEVHQKD